MKMLGKTRRRLAILLLMALPLAGTVMASGCLETALLALNPCGTVLKNCTPETWYALVWPVIEAPNYDRDPSCTIPYGCGPWFGTAGSGISGTATTQ
jgi:hypothetical protein